MILAHSAVVPICKASLKVNLFHSFPNEIIILYLRFFNNKITRGLLNKYPWASKQNKTTNNSAGFAGLVNLNPSVNNHILPEYFDTNHRVADVAFLRMSGLRLIGHRSKSSIKYRSKGRCTLLIQVFFKLNKMTKWDLLQQTDNIFLF